MNNVQPSDGQKIEEMEAENDEATQEWEAIRYDVMLLPTGFKQLRRIAESRIEALGNGIGENMKRIEALKTKSTVHGTPNL